MTVHSVHHAPAPHVQHSTPKPQPQQNQQQTKPQPTNTNKSGNK